MAGHLKKFSDYTDFEKLNSVDLIFAQFRNEIDRLSERCKESDCQYETLLGKICELPDPQGAVDMVDSFEQEFFCNFYFFDAF